MNVIFNYFLEGSIVLKHPFVQAQLSSIHTLGKYRCFKNLVLLNCNLNQFKQCPLLRHNRISERTMSHAKCRNTPYPRTRDGIIERLTIPGEKVDWSVPWPDYNPPTYTMSDMKSKPWADPDISNDFQPKWNQLDGKINRRSHITDYRIENGYPVNPIGRSGLRGRGCLGRWGPNHAADPIVTRWKRQGESILNHKTSGNPILQFVAIERKDCGEWAIPGGMVDPGEVISTTLRREFCEEALNSMCLESLEKEKLEEKLNVFFSKGEEIYRGYVDDPRNTDNAWMETVVYLFHDDTGDIIGQFNLQAGDDAAKVQWTDISSDLQLYASHKDFLHKVSLKLKAHW